MNSTEINYSKIYTADEFASLTPEQSKHCFKEGLKHQDYLKKYWNISNYNSYYITNITQPTNIRFVVKRAEEIASGARYNYLSPIERATLSTNICFNSDERFIEALLNKGVSLRHIEQINACIPKIRSLLEYSKELELDNSISILEKNIITITRIMNKYFGVDVPHVVINKAHHILAYNRELFEQMEKQQKGKSY